ASRRSSGPPPMAALAAPADCSLIRARAAQAFAAAAGVGIGHLTFAWLLRTVAVGQGRGSADAAMQRSALAPAWRRMSGRRCSRIARALGLQDIERALEHAACGGDDV